MGVTPFFWSKLMNTQCGVGGYTYKSPIINCANVLRLQKNSLKLNAASHNNASWNTDPEGFLEHSLSEGSLYYKGPAHLPEDNSVFWGVPRLYGVSHIVPGRYWKYREDTL